MREKAIYPKDMTEDDLRGYIRGMKGSMSHPAAPKKTFTRCIGIYNEELKRRGLKEE